MKRILLIDDNPRNNSGYIKDLESHFDVDVVLKLVSAIRLLSNNTYDVIVIDVMMPTEFLKIHNEMTTGFVFFQEYVLKLGLTCPVIFWSRLEEDSYSEFWPNTPPNNTYFLHKDESSNHLTIFIKNLLKDN